MPCSLRQPLDQLSFNETAAEPLFRTSEANFLARLMTDQTRVRFAVRREVFATCDDAMRSVRTEPLPGASGHVLKLIRGDDT